MKNILQAQMELKGYKNSLLLSLYVNISLSFSKALNTVLAQFPKLSTCSHKHPQPFHGNWRAAV